MWWNQLTQPSAALTDGLERRQARLLAAALVFLLPVWCLTLTTAIATRAMPLQWHQWLVAIINTALGFTAYAFSRSRHYRVAAIILIVTSVVGSHVSAFVEVDRLRTVVSMLYGATGPLYAAVFLNTRWTLISAVAAVISFAAFGAAHPHLTAADFVLPMFLLGFILALTVVAAAVRERQLETIQAQSQHLHAVVASANDALAVVGVDGLVTDWSRRAESMFGLTQRAAVGRPFATLVTQGLDVARLEAAFGHGATRLEFDSKATARQTIEASIAPLPGGAGAVVVLRDVTERKSLEARLMMTDRLETMGRMVAGVAHEINNPLAYVQANLRALAEDLESPNLERKERRELMAELLDGTRRMQSIVKDLLTFSRNSGEHDSMTAVLVEPTLESAIQIASVHVTRAHATVMRQYTRVGAVLGIEARLGQVFLTLLMNAVQALPATGGRREIIVSTKRVGDRVVVSVRDFGHGMTPEVKAKLFTPFFTTKPVGQGTGLGLSIAHSIVTSLGGELHVESAAGQGALFEVRLPVLPDA